MGQSTIILGSGPSLRNAGRGREIMLFDNIIRLSQTLYWQNKEDYGDRTDYVVVTQQNIGDILNCHVNEATVWIWTRPGWLDEKTVFDRIGKFHPQLCYETDMWAGRFAELDARGYKSERDPNPIFSSGLAAIIIAMERLDQDKIITAGFDEFWHDDMGNFHDWNMERVLLDEIAAKHRVTVQEWD